MTYSDDYYHCGISDDSGDDFGDGDDDGHDLRDSDRRNGDDDYGDGKNVSWMTLVIGLPMIVQITQHGYHTFSW